MKVNFSSSLFRKYSQMLLKFEIKTKKQKFSFCQRIIFYFNCTHSPPGNTYDTLFNVSLLITTDKTICDLYFLHKTLYHRHNHIHIIASKIFQYHRFFTCLIVSHFMLHGYSPLFIFVVIVVIKNKISMQIIIPFISGISTRKS